MDYIVILLDRLLNRYVLVFSRICHRSEVEFIFHRSREGNTSIESDALVRYLLFSSSMLFSDQFVPGFGIQQSGASRARCVPAVPGMFTFPSNRDFCLRVRLGDR